MSPTSEITSRVLPAIAVTVPFGAVGYLLRGVTRAGALAGTACAFAIYIGLGWGGFVTLAAVFLITWVATKSGALRKAELGLAQDHRGRNAGQVLANVGVAALFALFSPCSSLFTVAGVAALSEAAADTTQSEIGQIASAHPRMITHLRRVPPGTDGGVSFPGLLSGVISANMVGIVAAFCHVLMPRQAFVAAMAGVLGSLVDSLLGATLERAGWLTNNLVNLLSTVSAGTIAIVISILSHSRI